MRILALATAALLTALPVAMADTVSDTIPVTCTAAVHGESGYGAGCGLEGSCYQVEWGYHSDFLTAGGHNSCAAGVWTDPGAQPEEPLDFLGPVSGMEVPVFCRAAVDDAGTSGAGCGVQATCSAVLWGYHSEFLTVGGSGCSGGVWANPDEEPEGILPVVGGLCVNLVSIC